MPGETETTPSGGAYDDIETHPLGELATRLQGVSAGERLRFREDLASAGVLDAALLTADSDTLVVTFHGSLDRSKYRIPRFERARTTEVHGTSCLYWADPSLWLDDSLALAAYTGAGSINLLSMLAERSADVARLVGANRIIFTGSSGGGFAALQTSALIDASTALVFNPQTEISRYWQTVQRKYLEVCHPEVLPGSAADFDFSYDWSESLDDRFSAVRRYSRPTENKVLYWTNTNDWHHARHFRPFRNAVQADGDHGQRLTTHSYKGEKGHHTPSASMFTRALENALVVARPRE